MKKTNALFSQPMSNGNFSYDTVEIALEEAQALGAIPCFVCS